MLNIWGWVVVANTVVIVLLLFAPIPILVDIAVAPKNMELLAKTKLLGFVRLNKTYIKIEDYSIKKIKNDNQTTVTPITELSIKKPKYIYLLGAFKLKKLKSQLVLNMMECLAKINKLAYFGISLLYVCDGVAKANKIRSTAILSVSESEISVAAVKMLFTVSLIDLAARIVKHLFKPKKAAN